MIRFSAKYFDGIVSSCIDVTIELDDNGQLHILGLPDPAVFPLKQVRVAPRLGNTMRKVTLPDGAICESEDHAALDELLRYSGRGGAWKLIHRLESTWRAALVATVVLIVGGIVGIRWGIPLAAKHIAQAIPPAMAYDLGRGTIALMDRSMFEPTLLSVERQGQLTSGFDAIAREYPELPLNLHFRRGVGPNAFALPDGSVIVTDELVALVKDDNEIYSVLVHEIGHVHHRHALRMALESSTVAILVSAYLGDVTQLSAISGTLPGVIAQSSYSREHETEADTFALIYLDRSHIPRHHYANVLRSLQKMVGKEPKGGMQLMASHPPTAERIRRFEQ